MPIATLANLLLGAGVPKISPSTLPSFDFTFRPSVLAAAGAGAVLDALAAGGELGLAAGAGDSVFWREAQPKTNARHATETSSLLEGMRELPMQTVRACYHPEPPGLRAGRAGHILRGGKRRGATHDQGTARSLH